MAVRFILGRSGTGKTSLCIKAVAGALLQSADSRPIILLVPEQATYQAERAILSDKRIAGYNRLNVLSFDRLQFLLSGRNTARPAISRIGQQMIIHRLLLEHNSKLKVLGSLTTWPGLGRQMRETIAELHQYAKGSDDIERLVTELHKNEHNNLTAAKFEDIGLILKEYLSFIEGKFIDPDIQLSRCRQAVAKSAFTKDAKLWVDGFAGFTTSELQMLAELMKAAADTHIALCLDASKTNLTNQATARAYALTSPDVASIEPAGLFSTTQRTYAVLVDIVKKCRLKLAEPIILDKAARFAAAPPLAHIEKNIFETEPPKAPPGDNVRIVSAPGIRSEVQFVARQILQLVGQKGYRYRDIAVIASDIERYEHYIKAYFDDYGIPFFIDRRKSLSRHPVAALICSALQVVTGGFCSDDIFVYLRCGLVPLKDGDIDLLDNYCLAFGVKGSDWQGEQQWRYQDENDRRFDEGHINQLRLEVVRPLLKLRDGLCSSTRDPEQIAGRPTETLGGNEFTRTVFDFLDGLGVRQTIGRWIEQAVEQKDYAAADEHRQFYKRMVDVFDELVEVFSGRQLSCEDYLAIINSAFSQLKLAFIPPSLDQVLVGSIERSRHPDLKAVFLIGATQKQFPVVIGSSGILADDDRIAAESVDFVLAPAAAQSLAERQYLAYIAFTRASEFLSVSYPLLDDKGGAAIRSQFITNLESLFENLTEQSVADEQIRAENIYSETELVDLLCSRLGKDTAPTSNEQRTSLEGLLTDICADKELSELGLAVRSALDYDNCARVDKEVIKQLFGPQIESSATRLASFAACPYQHFAKYILKLSKRKEFRLEPIDVGTFYHRILDALLKYLNAEKKDFTAMEDKELLEILRDTVAEYVRTDSFAANFVRHSPHNAFIIHSAGQTLEDCVLAIAQMARAGLFKLACSEISFGLPHEPAPAQAGAAASRTKNSSDRLGEYKIALSDGRVLSLTGKIDRLDTTDLQGRRIAIIFDYKRTDKPFSWSRFFHGLDMQLAIYILAVRKARGSQYADCVGAFYMPVETSPPKTSLSELQKQSDKFNYRAKGIFNGEFFRQLDGSVSSGWSKFYNFQISKQNGQYGDYGKSGALKLDDFEKLLRFTERKIAKLGKNILSGRIVVNPYRLGTVSPCAYCDYKSLCRFDWQINDYNPLVSYGKLDVLEKAGEQ